MAKKMFKDKLAQTRFRLYFVVAFQRREYMGLGKLEIVCVPVDFSKNQDFLDLV